MTPTTSIKLTPEMLTALDAGEAQAKRERLTIDGRAGLIRHALTRWGEAEAALRAMQKERDEARRERDTEQQFRALYLRERDEARGTANARAEECDRLAALKTAPVAPTDGARLEAARVAAALTVNGLARLLGYRDGRSVRLMRDGAQPLSPAAAAWLAGGEAWAQWCAKGAAE